MLGRLRPFLKKYVLKTRAGASLYSAWRERYRDKDTSVRRMRSAWNRLSRTSRLGFISHLQTGETWNEREFHIVGIRFVDRIMERFADYGEVEPSYGNVLEIGCGVGRFLKPLACRFKDVRGVDISHEMIKSAKRYCRGMPNISISVNDGQSLGEFPDSSFDYCFSAGVFQHITNIEVILNYVREALRVLRPGGLFLFQFVGSRTEKVGSGTTGAQITALSLDEGLGGVNYLIREVSVDPADPVRNVVIVIQKPKAGQRVRGADRSFVKYPMTERRWLSGVYDDITTRTQMHERLKKGPDRLTFYDK
jgi:ubiquinone/menaquinone biosynthesis C-methylase UbiE